MNQTNKDALCLHIRENAKRKGIHLLNVNGWVDHLHAFIFLTPSQNTETIINLIKGESSYWANRSLKWPEKFGWQNEYFAVTVSPSHFDAVNAYIEQQEDHHRFKTFTEEYDQFMNNPWIVALKA